MNQFETRIFIIMSLLLMVLMALKKESLSFTDALFYLIQVNALVVLNRINSKMK